MPNAGRRIPMTPEMIAKAVVAAARAVGDDPLAALQRQPGGARTLGRSVTAAADALVRHTLQPAVVVCSALGIRDTVLHQARARRSPAFLAASEAALLAIGGAIEPPPAARIETPPAQPQDPEPAPMVAKSVVPTPTPRPVPAPLPTRAPRRRSGHGAVRRAQVLQLKPLEGRRLRYCRRFLDAGWTLEDTAWLFDVDADALAIRVRGLAA